MKFEVSMLPVHITAVKRRLLKLLSSAWLLVYGVGFQNIKQDVKLSSVVCPYEGFKSMGVKVIKTQEMCKQ